MSGRLEKIKRMALEDLLNVNPDYAATGYAHLSYAACLGALLARKRGCDMELCQAAGFLHDVWLHERAPYSQADCDAHAAEGAKLARRMMENLCRDMAQMGQTDLFLLTDHTRFYEKLGWRFQEIVRENGGDFARCYHISLTPYFER